jgi:glycosyltransferase involved in cell wall biosynthesis/ribosome-associated translation inhibitor RaiA
MQFHILSFEGPDAYAFAGGLASRMTGLVHTLAEAGYETHLWFVGDPRGPGHETVDRLQLHRWCQWISNYHPGGVYDGEEGKRGDYVASLPPFLCQEVLLPHLRQGQRAVILAGEWHTVDAVLHLDWLLRNAGVRHQVMILWNANNTFAFEHIDWGRLAGAAIITTVSRYMKHLMQDRGVNPLVIPNGLSAETLLSPEREAVRTFRGQVRGRTVVSKVARWDPNKRWLLAINTVGAMKRVGWQPLLIARGGVEPHGSEVLAAAAAAGLRVVDRFLPQQGVRGLFQALEGLDGVDIVNLRSPLDPESRLILFHSSAAVLANSQHEPFGLVGLETMAAGGVACIGYTGEDYAVPGHNALALETDDPQEFLDLFGALRVNPFVERALRRAGRATAQQYTWSQVVHRNLLPRLGLIGGAWHDGTPMPHDQGRRGRMHLHIAGHHTNIPPHLLGWIAERLEDLDAPHNDILQARVIVVGHKTGQRCRQEARIELTLAAQTLSVTQVAKTPYDAVYAALKATERQLRAVRSREHAEPSHDNAPPTAATHHSNAALQTVAAQ